MRRPGNHKLIVGYDLGNEVSQISYYAEESGEVETVSAVAGEEVYGIPTVLCKRYGTNQWLYGREAVKAAQQEEGVLVENLVGMAVDGEPVRIDGETYDPVALLTLFLKRSFGLLASIGPMERIGALMFTCKAMDHELISTLEAALGGLRLRAKHLCFQSYEDSFYQYMVHQPEELRLHQVLLCWYDRDCIKVYRMRTNHRTTPKAVYMEQEEFAFPTMETMPEAEEARRERFERMDRAFLERMRAICDRQMISSVFLIGDGFYEEWMKESLRYLCFGRRVFLGSNLYSKGACLGMMERIRPSAVGKGMVLLGNDKLKTNVGMRVSRRGEESYCALLDAGINWYEASSEHEFYMQDANSFDLVLTPLTGQRARIARVTLDGLDYPVSRLHLKVTMPSEDRMEITVEDLGFGEFREASRKTWTEELPVYE